MANEVTGPATNTVGIRQVYHNGVAMKPAMRLDIVGGTLTTEKYPDGVLTYKLVVPDQGAIADMLTRLETLENQMAKLLSVIKFGGEFEQNTQIWPAAEGGFVQVYAFNGQQIISAGDANPTAVLGFFGAEPQGRQIVIGDWNNNSPDETNRNLVIGAVAKGLGHLVGSGLLEDQRTNL